MENCRSFKSFGFIYIYIYIDYVGFVQIFYLFYKKKSIFSILHIHFYKILISVYLFYTFIQ